jgi:hypothetical protein
MKQRNMVLAVVYGIIIVAVIILIARTFFISEEFTDPTSLAQMLKADLKEYLKLILITPR